MAFVFKAESKSDQIDSSLGPGTYLSHGKYKFQQNKVPFLSRTSKFPSFPQKNEQPNSENLDLALTSGFRNVQVHERMIQESIHWKKKQDKDRKTEGVVFKSNTSRFNEERKIPDFPGPGAYESVGSFKESKAEVPKKKEEPPINSVIDEIMNKGNYQPIPSIPNPHSQGYGDMIPEKSVFRKGSQEPVNLGPGSYEFKDSYEMRRHKGYSWGNKQITRSKIKNLHDNSNLGPGCYDVRFESKALYKYKPMNSFVSSISRSVFEMKDPEKSRAKLLLSQRRQKAENTENLASKSLIMLETTAQNYQSQILGPGSYYNEKLATSINVKTKPIELQNFGSSSQRFTDKIPGFKTLGPGKYNPKEAESIKMAPLVNVPFLSSNERFEANLLRAHVPGPGAYNSNKKIRKNKAPEGFGVKEDRFRCSTDQKEEKPGPGTYIDPLIAKKSSSVSNFYFKSGSERDMFSQDKAGTPGAGAYNTNNLTIERSFNKLKEVDPELLKKKPAFNVKEERFTPLKKEGSDDEFDLALEERNPKIHAKVLGSQYLKKPKKGTTVPAKAVSSGQKREKLPGPGHYYDPNSDPWNKKTFNIMFADF